MKVTIIEGSPAELAEYEARTGVIGQTLALVNGPGQEEPLPTGDGQVISQTNLDNDLILFILGRGRTAEIRSQVEKYVRRVLDLGGAEVEIGTSQSSKDGYADYLLVYNAGPRRYGAVAYVNAKNAGLTLRLTKDDVHDVNAPGIKFRDVQPGNVYQVNCPVKIPDAVDLAIELTQRALDKVRGSTTN